MLSGKGSEHLGVLQEWFGFHWWNTRAVSILFIVLFVMLPLVLFRRVGEFFYFFIFSHFSEVFYTG